MGGVSPEQVITDERLDSLERRMDDVEKWQKDVVPNGDHVGHSRYHTLMIEQIEERRRLRQAVQEKTIAGLVWGFIVFCALAAWAYIKAEITK
jgi:hypothetical protein